MMRANLRLNFYYMALPLQGVLAVSQQWHRGIGKVSG